MTMLEIIMVCVGMLITAIVMAMVGIVIVGIIWWAFKTDMDIEIDSSEWEEEQ